jgi:hypothetical protein
MNEKVQKLTTQLEARQEVYAAECEEAGGIIKRGLVPRIAHAEGICKIQREIIEELKAELSGAPAAPAAVDPAPAPAAPAAVDPAPAAAAPAAVKVAPKATTAPTTTAAKTYVCDALPKETRDALAAYNAIDVNDAAGREAFRKANAKALGL